VLVSYSSDADSASSSASELDPAKVSGPVKVVKVDMPSLGAVVMLHD